MTLDIPGSDGVRLSYDAGNYVCNFSMFVIAEYCRNRGRRVGFIHLPKGAGREAENFIGDLIGHL